MLLRIILCERPAVPSPVLRTAADAQTVPQQLAPARYARNGAAERAVRSLAHHRDDGTKLSPHPRCRQVSWHSVTTRSIQGERKKTTLRAHAIARMCHVRRRPPQLTSKIVGLSSYRLFPGTLPCRNRRTRSAMTALPSFQWRQSRRLQRRPSFFLVFFERNTHAGCSDSVYFGIRNCAMYRRTETRSTLSRLRRSVS